MNRSPEDPVSDSFGLFIDPTFAIDLSGHVIAWNPAIQDLTGTPSERILGKGDQEYAISFYGYRRPALVDLIQEPGEVIAQYYSGISRSGSILIAETDLSCLMGEPVIVQIRVYPLRTRTGEIIGRVETIRDITRYKRTEEALRESEEKFRSFVEDAGDTIYSLTPEGIFTYVSPRWTELLGYETSEVIGKHAELFIHPEDYPRNRELFIRSRTTGKKISGNEYRIRLKDGTWQWHSQSISPIHDASGGIIRFQGISRDITESKTSEEALRRANRQLGLLTDVTRHDILNKIAVIYGYLGVIEVEYPDPELGEYLRIMKSSVKEIQSQVEFTRVYQALGSQSPQWVLLDTVMPRELLPGFVTLTTELHGISVFADPMLEKVFTNLLDNSLRHGGDVTAIRVSVHESGTGVLLVFEDDGAGIPGEEKERIFERGYGNNTGLGMFLVREILSLTRISIRETGVLGTGARFEITVPAGGWKRK